MKNRKDLSHIAITALILASVTPMTGHTVDFETDGILLAAGCPQHGCPTSKKNNGERPIVSENERISAPASVNLTEIQLLESLSPQGKEIYLSLDAEGKSLAIQLASQGSYRDKTLAVKEAKRRMNERR